MEEAMQHVHSISELRSNFSQLAEICHKENEPVFLTRRGHSDLVLLSMDGYERLVSKLKQNQGNDVEIEALWVREAEARYDEIEAGKVVCRPLDEAVEDARRAIL